MRLCIVSGVGLCFHFSFPLTPTQSCMTYSALYFYFSAWNSESLTSCPSTCKSCWDGEGSCDEPNFHQMRNIKFCRGHGWQAACWHIQTLKNTMEMDIFLWRNYTHKFHLGEWRKNKYFALHRNSVCTEVQSGCCFGSYLLSSLYTWILTSSPILEALAPPPLGTLSVDTQISEETRSDITILEISRNCTEKQIDT